MKRTSLIAIIVLALAVIGIVVHLARLHTDETETAQPRENPAPSQPAPGASAAASPALASCVGPRDSQISIASLDSRHQWTHSLLAAKRMDAAVNELRNIAAVDPGYPGVNLEISDALLKSRHAGEAREAIKQQIAISECLANLPQNDVQVYCKSEWASPPAGGCVPELAKINQQAHYQAGLLDAALVRNAGPHPAATDAANTGAPPAQAALTPVSTETNSAAAVLPKPLPLPIIKSAEASDHVGQRATVCGQVVSKHTSEESNGKPTFINLDRLFPNQTFTVVVWGTDAPAVGEIPDSGKVSVTGTIATYRGNPQVVLHDAKSWYRSEE